MSRLADLDAPSDATGPPSRPPSSAAKYESTLIKAVAHLVLSDSQSRVQIYRGARANLASDLSRANPRLDQRQIEWQLSLFDQASANVEAEIVRWRQGGLSEAGGFETRVETAQEFSARLWQEAAVTEQETDCGEAKHEALENDARESQSVPPPIPSPHDLPLEFVADRPANLTTDAPDNNAPAAGPPPISFDGPSAAAGEPRAIKKATLSSDQEDTIHPRLLAMIKVGRYHGVELDPDEYAQPPDAPVPTPAALSQWAQNAGMWSRAVRINWRQLLGLSGAGPLVLLLTDGSAALATGVTPGKTAIEIRSPTAAVGVAAIEVDELRLSQVWTGEAVLLRAARGALSADALFSLRWLLNLVLKERRSLRDIAIASITISFLTVFPPLVVMTMVNKVLQFRSLSTLAMLSAMMLVVVVYESLLSYSRRLIIAVIGARLDAKLNLHVFNRLLRLPLDYFERHPAGETMYKVAQVHRVREFLTGKLLTTVLDLVTLCVLLPFLFYINAILAAVVLVCGFLISLIIFAFLKPLRETYSRVTSAETWKSATLGETVVGIRTVKALALEPQRRALWDERIAEAGKARLEFARLTNWPQT
ncbi:MAG TPA: ABC transporter transmembrane domain-containing protein, partial [Stellaceae bacterium]|nr:ABC transporter transmembrane domain-containing protein [Stellaceae bacterium]